MGTDNSLGDFSWDQNIPEIDFFGETKNEVTPESKPDEGDTSNTSDDTEDKGETSTEKLENKEDKDDESIKLDFFNESESDDDSNDEGDSSDEDDDSDKDSNNSSNTLSNTGVLNFLKDKGLLNFELEEGEELDEDSAEEYLENAFDESVDSRLEQMMADLPDTVKNLVKYASNGGDVNELIGSMAKSAESGVSSKMDISDESNQEKFMRFKLSQEGNGKEYIDAQIEFLKDTNRLESVSTESFDKWKVNEEQAEKQRVKAQQEAVKEAKREQIRYRQEIIKHAAEVGSIKSLKISKQDARELPDYITSASEELEDGRVTTPFYRDLTKALKDKDQVLVLAKLLKNGFDFKDIEKAAASRATSKVKENIQRQEKTKGKTSTAGGSSQKRLADYF